MKCSAVVQKIRVRNEAKNNLFERKAENVCLQLYKIILTKNVVNAVVQIYVYSRFLMTPIDCYV